MDINKEKMEQCNILRLQQEQNQHDSATDDVTMSMPVGPTNMIKQDTACTSSASEIHQDKNAPPVDGIVQSVRIASANNNDPVSSNEHKQETCNETDPDTNTASYNKHHLDTVSSSELHPNMVLNNEIDQDTRNTHEGQSELDEGGDAVTPENIQISDVLNISMPETNSNLRIEQNVSDNAYLEAVRKGLRYLADDDALCDVTLVVERRKFRCHKVVLATFSEYFQAIFTVPMKEAEEDEIRLSGFSSDTIQQVLHYIYRGSDGFTASDGRTLLQAAIFFRIDSLRLICETVLSYALDCDNAIHLWQVTRCFPECQTLKNKCEEYLLHNFLCLNEDDVVKLDEEELLFLISHPDLSIPLEDKVCQIAMHWFEYDREVRKPHLAKIFEHVRLVFVSTEAYLEFRNKFTFAKDPAMIPFLEEVQTYTNDPSSRMNSISSRTTLRSHYSKEKVLLIIGYSMRETNLWAWRISNRCWHRLAARPYKLGKSYATCQFGESEVYFAGGQGRSTFQKFDGMFDKIIPCRQMRTSRLCHCMVPVGDQVYVLGGDTFQFCKDDDSAPTLDKLDSVEAFKPSENSWKSCGRINIAVSGAASCVSGTKIYMYGGFQDGENEEPSNLTQFFDTETNTSGYLQFNLPFLNRNIQAVNVNGVSYVISEDALFTTTDDNDFVNVKSLELGNESACFEKLMAMTKDVKTIFIMGELVQRHFHVYLADSKWVMLEYDTKTGYLETASEAMFTCTDFRIHTLMVDKKFLSDESLADLKRVEKPTTANQPGVFRGRGLRLGKTHIR